MRLCFGYASAYAHWQDPSSEILIFVCTMQVSSLLQAAASSLDKRQTEASTSHSNILPTPGTATPVHAPTSAPPASLWGSGHVGTPLQGPQVGHPVPVVPERGSHQPSGSFHDRQLLSTQPTMKQPGTQPHQDHTPDFAVRPQPRRLGATVAANLIQDTVQANMERDPAII